MAKSAKLLAFLEKLFGEKNETIIDITDLTTEGANYSSIIFKISVTKKNGEHLHLFAKVASIAKEIRQQMNADIVFELEKDFYLTMKPLYDQLQNKYISNPKDRFIIPKMYGFNEDLYEETVVLEDLGAQGYILYDRFKPLTLEYTTKAVQEIAKFHALSFACKYEYPELYAKNVNKFNWNRSFLAAMKETFIKSADSIYNILPQNIKNRYKKFVDNAFSEEQIEKYCSFGKWGILIHGDYRASNIMYKVLENGEISSLIPVDYQTLNTGSPTLDLIYLIYLGTDEKFRRNHLKDTLEIYYKTLSSWLAQMKLNPNEIISKDDFYEEYNDMISYGLFIATFLLPIVLVDIKDAPDFDKSNATMDNLSVKLSDKFKERFIPILNEFADMGII